MSLQLNSIPDSYILPFSYGFLEIMVNQNIHEERTSEHNSKLMIKLKGNNLKMTGRRKRIAALRGTEAEDSYSKGNAEKPSYSALR